MSVEQAQDRPVAPIAASGRPYREPSSWLIVALATTYVVALAALVFLPGDTLLNRLRALDGGICAQNPLHSFFPAGQQLPLCSRNTGIYIGFASTFLTLAALGRLRAAQFPARWVLLVLGAAVLFMAEDGFNSLFLDLGLPHLYQPHNLLRLASGLGTGVAMCAVLLPVANTLIWRDEDDRASFGSLRELAVMLPVLILVFLAVGSQTAPLLYPVALLSSAGLVMALTLVNLVFVLGIGNKVGRFATWRQLVPAFALIVALAVVELTLLFHLKLAALSALHVP
jgi:uncharacterized membrane protein